MPCKNHGQFFSEKNPCPECRGFKRVFHFDGMVLGKTKKALRAFDDELYEAIEELAIKHGVEMWTLSTKIDGNNESITTQH